MKTNSMFSDMLLPLRGMGSFFLPDKELRGRKIVREFRKELLEKQSESK
jgi:hypothetical protein